MARSGDTLRPARRKLRFNTIDDALTEANRLVAADAEGRLDRAGNWTLGQTLGHLATWVKFAFDGYPEEVIPSFPQPLILRLRRNHVVHNSMKPGVRIGKIPAGTVGVKVLPADEGLRRFHAALHRLKHTPPTIADPALGKLSHEQWIQMNLRHAELHLGHFVPRK